MRGKSSESKYIRRVYSKGKMEGRKRPRRRVKGYTSVFLVMIVCSVILAGLVMTEAAAGFAARSIGENVCAVAGRSVLSEYQKDLYRRYGLFAIRKSEYFLQSKASFYIDSSLSAKNGLVRIHADSIYADTSKYEFSDKELKRQIDELSDGLDRYIVDNCSNTVSSREDTYLDYETEYIIYGHAKEDSNRNAAKRDIYEMRYGKNLIEILTDKDLMQTLQDQALLLFPEGAPIIVGLLAATEAARRTETDVKKILSGENVPMVEFLGIKADGFYEDYLSLLLKPVSERKKLKRLKEVMEKNIIYEDQSDFSFSDYAFGFDLEVNFSKNASAQMLGITKRKAVVRQSFVYQ